MSQNLTNWSIFLLMFSLHFLYPTRMSSLLAGLMQLTQYVCSQYFRKYHFLPFENNCLQSPVNLGRTNVVWCLQGCSWCCLATRWQRPLWCLSAQDQVPLLQVKLNSQRVNFSFNLLKCLALYQVYTFHHQGGWILSRRIPSSPTPRSSLKATLYSVIPSSSHLILMLIWSNCKACLWLSSSLSEWAMQAISGVHNERTGQGYKEQ